MLDATRRLLDGFRRVHFSDYPVLSRYFGLLRKPRYFCSTTVLATNPFYIKIVDDCLLVLKRQWISGYPIVYLIQPPISLAQDRKRERQVVDEFAAISIPTRMTDDDASNLGVPISELTAKGVDYIYDMVNAYSGSNAHRQTYIKRIFDRLSQSKRLLLKISTGNIQDDMQQDALTVIGAWHTQHDESPMRANMKIKRFNELAKNGNVMLSVSYLDGKPFDCTLSEVYGANYGVYVFGYYDQAVKEIVKDFARYETIIDNSYWIANNPNYQFASGGIRSGSRKLAYAKQKLNPVAVNSIYQNAGIPRFSKEIYHRFGEDKYGNLVFKES